MVSAFFLSFHFFFLTYLLKILPLLLQDQRRHRHTQMQRQEPADVVFDSDSDDAPPPDEIQIFTSPPIENTDMDGQSFDDRPISIDGGSGFFPEFRCAPVSASAEAWNIFASSSSDDESENADASGRRYAGADDRAVSWQ
jgi:hypothetical protein